MVTHDINAAAINSDRVLALKDGRLVFGGSPAELMCNDVLKRVFDKEFALVRHPHTDQIVIVPEALS
jgi:iron complex transport system ATP-binding protein